MAQGTFSEPGPRSGPGLAAKPGVRSGRGGVGRRQRMAGYAILAALCAIALWLGLEQARFNPAVIVAMNAPKGKGRVVGGAAGSASPAGQAATAAFFPDAPGFSALTPIETYDPETLSDKIDGKAELYLPAGFKEMSCRGYALAGGTADGAHVDVYVYDMASPPGAFAVFSGQRRPGSGDVALGDNAYATPNALFFSKGPYYVEMVADRAAPGLEAALEGYATALLAALPAEEGGAKAASESALFPKEGLQTDTVRLSASDTFGLEGFGGVYTAEYRLERGEATAFLASRPTPGEAQAQADAYMAFLTANGYKELTPPGAPGSLRLFALDTSFEAVFVADSMLAGVHDASSREVAEELAARLKAALPEKTQ